MPLGLPLLRPWRGRPPAHGRAPCRVRSERRGSLEERRCRGGAAACLRSSRRPFQFGGNILVGRHHGVSAVPGPTVRIKRGIGGLRQCRMHVAALLGGGRLVGRRAHQRVAEPDPVAEIAELDQAGLFQYRRRGGADTELPGSPPKQRRVAEGLGAGQEQQSAGVEGQVLHRGAESSPRLSLAVRARRPIRTLPRARRP